MSIAIVGCGVAGTLLCLELLKSGKDHSNIHLIDPFLDGGALSRRWCAIRSNTRWDQITESMKEYTSAQKPIQELSQKYKPEDTVLLCDLGWLMMESLRPFLSDLNIYIDMCQSIRQKEDGGFIVKLAETQINCSQVFLCQGGKEKSLDFGKPCIPLEVALDPIRLSRMVRPSQHVVVFGLAHSGTLICKHLIDLQCHVYGVYNQEKPFYFAKDGYYDGIKQESAEIAELLLTRPPDGFELIKYQDTKKLIKVLNKSHWIISSIGFEASPIPTFSKEGETVNFHSYEPETAQIMPGLFGFGLAYPGVTVLDGKTYKDVSIPSFVQQIQKCLPSILSKS